MAKSKQNLALVQDSTQRAGPIKYKHRRQWIDPRTQQETDSESEHAHLHVTREIVPTPDVKNSLRETYGVDNPDAQRFLSEALALVMGDRYKLSDPYSAAEYKVNGAMALLHEMNPETACESMLASQIIGMHSVAIGCLQNADQLNGKAKQIELSLFARTSKTMTRAIEAYNRIKNGNTHNQNITVNHIDNRGGQAVVGDVNHGGVPLK